MITNEAVEASVLGVLEQHIQSARNKRCICGWRPTYPDTRSLFPEYLQHREHLAHEIAAALHV